MGSDFGKMTPRGLGAFLNGILDLTQAEGLNDLINAETESQFKISMSQYEGALSNKVNAWRDEVVWLLSKLEALIDFSDEDYDFNAAGNIEERLIKIKSSCIYNF